MGRINEELLYFFTQNYAPGAIGIVGTKDLIGLAIREAQSNITGDRRPSLWSHCFIMGEMRYDRRGTGNAVMKSVYLFESDLSFNPIKAQLRNGAQENWIGKWCAQKVEHAAVIDFGLPETENRNVLATALQLVDEQILYPIQELLGTWWAIITRRQWQPNPLNDPHAMYCSTFVRYCYREVEKDFLGSDVDLSNTTPEDIARLGIASGKIKIYKP